MNLDDVFSATDFWEPVARPVIDRNFSDKQQTAMLACFSALITDEPEATAGTMLELFLTCKYSGLDKQGQVALLDSVKGLLERTPDPWQ
ncbi:hypothetical protein ACWOEH_05280 [Enterococcus nangangensis]